MLHLSCNRLMKNKSRKAGLWSKPFSDWHTLKEKLNNNQNIPAGCKERGIWWMSVGVDIGFEEDV